MVEVVRLFLMDYRKDVVEKALNLVKEFGATKVVPSQVVPNFYFAELPASADEEDLARKLSELDLLDFKVVRVKV